MDSDMNAPKVFDLFGLLGGWSDDLDGLTDEITSNKTDDHSAFETASTERHAERSGMFGQIDINNPFPREPEDMSDYSFLLAQSPVISESISETVPEQMALLPELEVARKTPGPQSLEGNNQPESSLESPIQEIIHGGPISPYSEEITSKQAPSIRANTGNTLDITINISGGDDRDRQIARSAVETTLQAIGGETGFFIP